MASPIDISVPYPEAGELLLRLIAGPCRLRITPAEGEPWVGGTYDDPTGLLPLQIAADGSRVTIRQATHIGSVGSVTRAPVLDLRLSRERPFQLTLEGGANDQALDLGGLPITRMTMRHGAGRVDVDFSRPNPAEMDALDVTAGAATVRMRSLANANVATMVVSGGAAQYELDFAGELRRDADVRLNTGVAAVELKLPATNAAVVRADAVMGGLRIGDGFTTREGAYWNAAAVAGGQPVIRLAVNSMLGSVRVHAS